MPFIELLSGLKELKLKTKLWVMYFFVFLLSFGLGNLIMFRLLKNTFEENMANELKNSSHMIKNMVNATMRGSIENYLYFVCQEELRYIQDLNVQVQKGEYSLPQAQDMAIALIRERTIGLSGYICIADSSNKFVYHPMEKGKVTSYEKLSLIKEQKNFEKGYMEYNWRNKGEQVDRKKAFYMDRFAPWGWQIFVTAYREDFPILIDTEHLEKVLLSIKLSKSGYPFIIDLDGNVIIHPELSGNINNLQDRSGGYIIQKICAQKNGNIRYSWRSSPRQVYRDKWVDFEYLEEYGWIVASSCYMDELYEPLQKSRMLAILSFGFAFAVSLLLIRTFSSKYVRRIHGLCDGFIAASQGNLSVRIRSKTRDELGLLGLYFNQMIESLEVETQKRKGAEEAFRKNQAELENRVEERTQKLAVVIKELENEINERESIQEALKESEAQFRLISEQSLMGIAVIQEGYFRYVNQKLADIMECSVHELLTGEQNMFLKFVHPDDFAFVADQAQKKQRGHQEVVSNYSFKGFSRDGQLKWVELYSKSIQYRGQNALLFTLVDISQRKQAELALIESEKKYRSIFENAAEGVFQVEPDGRLITVNPSFVRMFGFQSEEEIFSMGIFRKRIFVNPDQLKQYEHMMLHVGYVHNFEFQAYRKDMSVINVMVSAHVIYNYNDEILYFEGMLVDISQQKRAHDLELAKEAAESANQAKDRFIAHMSHEIRTPMNAILGFTNLVLKSSLLPKQEEFMQKIHSSASTLLHIINDILDFSKIEAEKLEIEHISFHIYEIFEKIVDIFCEKSREKGLVLNIEMDYDIPLKLIGDPLRIGQILINLISNSLKFTERGSVSLSVKMKSQADASVLLEFTVQDTGIGMNGETLDKIFDPFTQADESITRQYGGTGLGLPITRQLVKLMDGEIQAQSQIGQGSVFQVLIPVDKTTDDVSFHIPEPFLGMNVLLIDDRLTCQLMLSQYLRTFSFDVTTADSYESAMNMPYEIKSRFQLIVLNLIDDRKHSLEMIRLTKEAFPNTQVITVGLFSLPGDQQHISGLPYLTKPIKITAFYNRIMRCFHQVELSREEESEFYSHTAPAYEVVISQDTCLLLVEDNRINQELAREILVNAGFQLDIADNGKHALDILAKAENKGKYAAVLMDIQMPIMDGVTAVRQMRKNPDYDEIPVIAMSAHAMKGDREKYLGFGMNDYVTKPIDMEQLFVVLGRWIDTAPPEEDSNLSVQSSFPANIDGFDLGQAERRVGGNYHLYLKLLGDFCENFGKADLELRSLLDAKDMIEAKSVVHQIKGVSGNLAATDLYDSCIDLEQALFDEDQERIDLCFLEFSHNLKAVILIAGQLNAEAESIKTKERISALSSLPLNALLNELESLINDSDYRAEQCFSTISKETNDIHIDSKTDLENALNQLDYAMAKDCFNKFKSDLEKRLH